MKVTFVYPRFEKFLQSLPELDQSLVDYFLGNFTTPPSLGIPILASLTPPDVEVQLIDDNAGQPVDFDAPTDLVAINCFTPQATRALEIADGYRARGRKVVMGGLFPTFMDQLCLQHADAVNVGEGEPTWPRILEDARHGRLQRRYNGGCSANLANLPIPDRSVFYRNGFYDWDEDLIQVSRGCVYTCAMCSLPAQMGNRIRFRPVDLVVRELQSLKHENVYLADDTLFFPHRRIRDYATALFKAIEPLGKKYFVSSTMALNTEPEFLDLAARAGVCNFYCTLNVDPQSIKALQGDPQERQRLADLVRATEERGIRFFASCGLGRDWDGPDIADRILDLFDAASIRTAEFFVFTPYPGSVHWDRLERQGRITDRHWARYNGGHVVFKPAQMSPEQLREQFVRVWSEFFKRQKSQHAAALEPSTWQDGVQVVGKPLQRRGIQREAAVTGLGLFSPLGHDPETVVEALRTGRHGISPVSRFDARHFRTNLGGEIKGFDPGALLAAPELAEYEDRYLQLAIAAARRALQDAALAPGRPGEPRRDIALVLGTCNGGLCSAEAEYAWKHGRSSRPFDERMNLQAQLYGFGKALASALHLGGECWVVTTACSSSTVALALAQLLIRRGYHHTVLVGGADVLCVANVSGFDALKATAPGRMAPFSAPSGLNIGEAAAFWVLESLDHALLRHARCLGRIVGHATSSDAHHPTSPDPRGNGVARTLALALQDSGLAFEDIGCINAHGTGTDANDKAESHGIQRFCGTRPVPPVTSTKSFFGHCMGATGILETTCQLLAMNAGFIPPTLNFSTPRPGCALDYVPNQSRPASYRAFLKANYAFGGNNAALAVTSWDHPAAAREPNPDRVVITGTACVSALGLGSPQTLAQLRAGHVGITPVRAFPLRDCRASRLGQVPEFRAADIDRRLDFSELNPISRYAVAAARLAFDHAGLRLPPSGADDIGVVLGVCNGPSEMVHMDSVFSSPNYAANIASFSNITSNSTAGWVSLKLGLRGVNNALSTGPHAGLHALAHAYDCLADRRARCIVAGAADEVYAQTFYNYDGMGFLFQADAEADYRLRAEAEKAKVLGDGAGMLLLERAESATERGARILAEVLGYGLGMDAEGFLAANLGQAGLEHAVSLALRRAGLQAADIDLIVWAPQGNRQDLKILQWVRTTWPDPDRRPPLVTTTFNTGFIESASIVVSLAAALTALDAGPELWPQRVGLAECDARRLSMLPRHVLALGSTDFGYNSAFILRRGWTP